MYPYATVQDARDAGITVAKASDERLEDLLEQASSCVDELTDQFFSPRRYQAAFDGHHHATLNLDIPLIELEEVQIRSTRASSPQLEPVELEDVVVYDRGRQRGQSAVADDGSPRLRLRHDVFWSIGLGLEGQVWPLGDQNVLITGTWGRTEARRGYVDTSLEPFVLVAGDDLQLRIDGAADSDGNPVVQTHVFQAGEFNDVASATADEVADALSGDVSGLLARGRYVTGGRVARLQSQLRAFSSRVEVIGGTAVPKLGLDVATEQFWPYGETPSEITHATVLLVKRELGFASSVGVLPGDAGPVKSQRTRSQDYELSVGDLPNQDQVRGSITGDPEIDKILIRYRRRPRVYVPKSPRRARPYC